MTKQHALKWTVLVATLTLGTSALMAAPTTAPTVVDAADMAAVTASLDKDVILEGVVDRAAWSASGKVMIINFKGADKSKFSAVAFEKIKDRLNNAFDGDAAKAFTGAKIHIRGKVAKYGGKVESLKDSLQIIVTDPSVVTIVEPAPGAATTKPA